MDTALKEHELGTPGRPLGFCLRCTHELIAGGDERCPECACPFSSRDHRSYYAFRPGWLARRFLSPPGFFWWLTFFLLSIYLMAANCAPGGYLIADILGGFALIVAASLYVLWLLFSLLVHLRFGRNWWGPRQLWWLVAPCIVFLSFLAILFQLPIRVGFWYSQEALQAQVGNATADPPSARPGWLGVYPVRYDDQRRHLLLVRGAGFINQHGFAYLPDIGDTDYFEEGQLRAWRFDGDWFLAQLQF